MTGEVERLEGLAAGGDGASKGRESADELRQALRRLMWEKVGVIREGSGLQAARSEILSLRNRMADLDVADAGQLVQVVKLTAMLTVGEMICRAALMRTESRGAHYRSDHPDEDNAGWLKTVEITRRGDEMTLAATEVPAEAA